MVNMCIFVQYMCVCVWNLAEKVTVVVDILTKQQRGSFFMGHPVVRFRSSKLRVLVQFGFGSIPISESTWTERIQTFIKLFSDTCRQSLFLHSTSTLWGFYGHWQWQLWCQLSWTMDHAQHWQWTDNHSVASKIRSSLDLASCKPELTLTLFLTITTLTLTMLMLILTLTLARSIFSSRARPDFTRNHSTTTVAIHRTSTPNNSVAAASMREWTTATLACMICPSGSS